MQCGWTGAWLNPFRWWHSEHDNHYHLSGRSYGLVYVMVTIRCLFIIGPLQTPQFRLAPLTLYQITAYQVLEKPPSLVPAWDRREFMHLESNMTWFLECAHLSVPQIGQALSPDPQQPFLTWCFQMFQMVHYIHVPLTKLVGEYGSCSSALSEVHHIGKSWYQAMGNKHRSEPIFIRHSVWHGIIAMRICWHWKQM